MMCALYVCIVCVYCMSPLTGAACHLLPGSQLYHVTWLSPLPGAARHLDDKRDQGGQRRRGGLEKRHTLRPRRRQRHPPSWPGAGSALEGLGRRHSHRSAAQAAPEPREASRPDSYSESPATHTHTHTHPPLRLPLPQIPTVRCPLPSPRRPALTQRPTPSHAPPRLLEASTQRAAHCVLAVYRSLFTLG